MLELNIFDMWKRSMQKFWEYSQDLNSINDLGKKSAIPFMHNQQQSLP